MKTILTLFFTLSLSVIFAQTTEYTTGQGYTDAWTGWSTPIETGTTSSTVNGVNVYAFSGTANSIYTVEMYKQFTIDSNDIDIYLFGTYHSGTITIQYSTDNVTYTDIGYTTFNGGYFGSQSLVVPTFNPVVPTFYLKIKAKGTFGSPSQLWFQNLKIDAVLNSTLSVSSPESINDTFKFLNTNSTIDIITDEKNYTARVFDLSGRLIYKEKDLTSYNFSNLNKGLYVLLIETDKNEKKVIKFTHS